MPLTTRPLTPANWPDFAALVERHNGVWGGCWCLGFHAEGHPGKLPPAQRRAAKEKRVHEGTAHAALVYDGELCVGWCQFGAPAELPRIKHQRAYAEVPAALPDWRITCFFVDRAHRGRGVAASALTGALEQIARLGGGTVESFPEAAEGRTVSSSFLHNATAGLFDRAGFTRVRKLGKDRWLVARLIAPAP